MSKHIFFDLDRTLWDFDKNSRLALSILFEEHNLHTHFSSFEAFHKTYKEINAKMWYQYGKGQVSKDSLRVGRFIETFRKHKVDKKELALHLSDEYVRISPYQTNLFPGTKETLDVLTGMGYQMHIITNGFSEIQHIKLKQSGIDNYFKVILCSEEVGVNKPNPEVFHFALDKSGAKATNSIMIGDDYNVDVRGATKVGMQAILFDPNEDYRKGTHDWQVTHMNEIPGMLPWIVKSTL